MIEHIDVPPRASKMAEHSTDRSPLYITGILIYTRVVVHTAYTYILKAWLWRDLCWCVSVCVYSFQFLCLSFAWVFTQASGPCFSLLRSNFFVFTHTQPQIQLRKLLKNGKILSAFFLSIKDSFQNEYYGVENWCVRAHHNVNSIDITPKVLTSLKTVLMPDEIKEG